METELKCLCELKRERERETHFVFEMRQKEIKIGMVCWCKFVWVCVFQIKRYREVHIRRV